MARFGVTTPVSDGVNVTVPVGEYPPETVAQHVDAEPTAKIAGMQETEVDVAVLTAIEVVPLLGLLSESPP